MRTTATLAVMLLGVIAANAFERRAPESPFGDYECVPIKRIGQNDPDPVYKIEINLTGDDKGVLSQYGCVPYHRQRQDLQPHNSVYGRCDADTGGKASRVPLVGHAF